MFQTTIPECVPFSVRKSGRGVISYLIKRTLWVLVFAYSITTHVFYLIDIKQISPRRRIVTLKKTKKQTARTNRSNKMNKTALMMYFSVKYKIHIQLIFEIKWCAIYLTFSTVFLDFILMRNWRIEDIAVCKVKVMLSLKVIIVNQVKCIFRHTTATTESRTKFLLGHLNVHTSLIFKTNYICI